MTLALEIILSAVFAYVVISFAEHFFHYWAMHRGFPGYVYRVLPFFKPILDDHRAHHQNYKEHFDYQPDPVKRELNLRFGAEHFVLIMIFYFPLLVVSYLVADSFVPVIIFSIIAYIHYRLWNFVHPTMHHGDHPTWTKWRVYKYLVRNHYLHHQDSRVRFNIVFPLADVILGSFRAPSDTEREEIERLGFLK